MLIIWQQWHQRKNRHSDERLADTNSFKDVFKQADGDYHKPLIGKSSRSSHNLFEKLKKRSGKVIEDADDFDKYVSQDECEKNHVKQTPKTFHMVVSLWFKVYTNRHLLLYNLISCCVLLVKTRATRATRAKQYIVVAHALYLVLFSLFHMGFVDK